MPLLFPGPALSPNYTAQRAGMVTWVTGLLNCTPGNVTQCLNDIENLAAQPGPNAGVTALRVTITGNGMPGVVGNANGPLLPVYHHSHGVVGVSSCSLFWIVEPSRQFAKIVGVARHQGAQTYQFQWVAGAGFVFHHNNGGNVPAVNATIHPF